MNLKIYVAHHKPGFVYNSDIYEPIQVGRALSDTKLPMIGDDTGDNISHLNPWYCELTAQYWVWKNVKNLDSVGFCHYRRCFSLNINLRETFRKLGKYSAHLILGNLFWPGKYQTFHQVDTVYDKTTAKMKLDKFSKVALRKIQNVDLIDLRRAYFSSETVRSHYCRHIVQDHLDKERDVLIQLHPEYKYAYEKVMNGREFFLCNMYLMKWSIFDDYMSWLFSILNEYHHRYGVWCVHDKRLFGYFGEHLFGVYMNTVKPKKYSVNMLNFCF